MDKTIKEKLYSVSYQHSFDKCGNIDVLMCSDMAKINANDKDIVKLEDVIKILKDFLTESIKAIEERDLELQDFVMQAEDAMRVKIYKEMLASLE